MYITQLLAILKEMIYNNKKIKDLLLSNNNTNLIAINLSVWSKSNQLGICHRFIPTLCNGSPDKICPFHTGKIWSSCEGFPYQYTEEELKNMDTKKVKKLLEEKQLSYDQYLLTLHWKKVRLLAIKKADEKCQLCNNNLSLHVHHRTYEHLGDEQRHLKDLTVLCRDCHQKFHGK